MIEQNNILEASIIRERRKQSLIFDTLELQLKRKRFLDWLTVNYYNPAVKTLEMYPGINAVIKSRLSTYQFFNKWHNTRIKIPSETLCEIDKLDFDRTISLINEVCSSLIRNNIHFAIFYAEGQRSPHVRIYDFEELTELSPYKREKAQVLFWRRHLPFGTLQYMDFSVLMDDHPIQLEFSLHWKYGTPFNLLFEWLPEEIQCRG